MLGFFLRWTINAAIILALAYYLPGMTVAGWYAAFVLVAVLGLVNTILRPLVLLLTLPINMLTFGLFTFVINGVLFWFVTSIVEGISVDRFGTAFIGALLFTIASWVSSSLFKKEQ